MRKAAILSFVLGCGGTSAAPTEAPVTVPPPPSATAPAGDHAIEARLGCTVITRKDVDAELEASSRMSDKPPARDEVRASMIRAVVVAKAARDREIEVTPGEIDAGIVAMATASKITSEQLMASVREHGVDENRYRAQVGEQVLEAKLRLQLAPGASGHDEIMAKSEPVLERLTKELMTTPCKEPAPT